MDKTIKVTMGHSLSTEELLDKVMVLLQTLGEDMTLSARWKSDFRGVEFEVTGGIGKGSKGELLLSPSSVTIEMELPLMLRPMSSKIRKDVEDDMRKAIYG